MQPLRGTAHKQSTQHINGSVLNLLGKTKPGLVLSLQRSQVHVDHYAIYLRKETFLRYIIYSISFKRSIDYIMNITLIIHR